MSWFDFDITSKLKVKSSGNRIANVYCVAECKIEFETIFQFLKFILVCFVSTTDTEYRKNIASYLSLL